MKLTPTSFPIALLLCCSLHGTWLSAQEHDKVVGSIGDIELHESEVLSSLGSLTNVDKEALSRDSAMLSKLVRSMLIQRVILQEALEKKWDEETSIQLLLKSTREAAITDSYLKSINSPPASYPDETELRAAYEAGRESLTVPRSFRLAQIYVADPEGADKQSSAKAKARLESVLKRLQQTGADFGLIALELSEEKESASRNGEIGWLTEKQIQPEILQQLPKLSLNVISNPVRLKDGWHILKVLDAREPFTPIFDQVRVQLAQRLRAEKTRANMQAYMAEMLHKHPVAVNEVALSKLLLANP
ncbi:peptidylprolyl isomerase [Prosthecobacter sp.]|uniref:peptidylprolyl isomerase n=1 Tax=Prosthecobacter sp. TaxID=1965333 RepID=UPI001E0EE015|nr:peptidylprolyl isomerase [Prosthecobacter sp.]MCB1276968.1 peptidylprolyl isomerase [Prosthecobacter sp.]